jgi:hypothetical protein
MDDARRADLIERYRTMHCEVLEGDGWQPLAEPPSEPQLLISAWNPGAKPATPEENAEHDAMLYRLLTALGERPVRARGRSGESIVGDEGWLVSYQPGSSVKLLRYFRQEAGMIVHRDGWRVLWCDGSTDRLDGAAGDVPGAPQPAMGSR